MGQPAFTKTYSIEEYFALETALVDAKHEYFDGEIIAMAGAHPDHNTVSVNLARELGNQIIKKGLRCRVYNSDQRVRAYHAREGKVGYVYPDVTVVCGKPEFANDMLPTLLNPTVIFEVLSDSTRQYDFGKKLDYYRGIASAQAIFFVSYDRAALTLLCRNGDEWILSDVIGIEQSLFVPSLDVAIPLSEVYRDIALS